jgi:hypothetical protein
MKFNNGKKTLLLLSDDLRMHSGIATMSREFVLGTVDKYNWVQLGAAINHPEVGKILDLSEDVRKNTGVKDACVLVYPYNGYGDADIVRLLLNKHGIDGIIHFTDPRYWIWLYDIEHEIRQNVPIMFYSIWDNVGNHVHNFSTDPAYNADYYASCDGIFGISKQTYGMVNRVVKGKFGEELELVNL